MTKNIVGAEAALTFKADSVEKERIKKGYRIREIDEKLREKRTRTEARLIREARRAGVLTPQVLSEDRFTITMEKINGKKVRDAIDRRNHKKIAQKIAAAVSALHSYGIVHGDLTTSNMIISRKKTQSKKEKNSDLCLIDFGLGFFSQRAEDKATDLHLLRAALTSTHHEFSDSMWKIVLDTYGKSSGAESVLKALSKIEKRGRYSKRKKNEGHRGIPEGFRPQARLAMGRGKGRRRVHG